VRPIEVQRLSATPGTVHVAVVEPEPRRPSKHSGNDTIRFFFTTLFVTLFGLAMSLTACGNDDDTDNAASPETLIVAWNDKLNAGDVDGVMASLSGDAVFINAPGQAGGPKLDTPDKIRSWVQRQVDNKTTAEQSDFEVNGNTVTWKAKVSRNGSVIFEGKNEAKFEDGKVVELTF